MFATNATVRKSLLSRSMIWYEAWYDMKHDIHCSISSAHLAAQSIMHSKYNMDNPYPIRLSFHHTKPMKQCRVGGKIWNPIKITQWYIHTWLHRAFTFIIRTNIMWEELWGRIRWLGLPKPGVCRQCSYKDAGPIHSPPQPFLWFLILFDKVAFQNAVQPLLIPRHYDQLSCRYDVYSNERIRLIKDIMW